MAKHLASSATWVERRTSFLRQAPLRNHLLHLFRRLSSLLSCPQRSSRKRRPPKSRHCRQSRSAPHHLSFSFSLPMVMTKKHCSSFSEYWESWVFPTS